MRSRASAPTFIATSGADGGEHVVVPGLDLHHARRLRRSEAAGERRAERDRHLAEDRAGQPLTEHALDPVHDLDGLDPAFEHGEQRALLAFVHRVFTGRQADIRAAPRQALAVGGLQ